MPFYYLVVVGAVMPRHHLLMVTVAGLTVVKMIGLAALAWGLLWMHSGAKRRLFPAATYVLFAVYYAIMLSLISLRGRLDVGNEFGKLISILVVLIVTYLLVDTREKFRRAILGLVVVAAISTYYVISQFVLFSAIYRGFRSFGGVAGDANYYALTIIMTVPFAIYLLTTKGSLMEKVICVGALGSILVGFTLVASRGGLVGIAASLGYLFLRYKKKLRILTITAMIAVPLLLYMPSSPIQRFRNPTRGDEWAAQSRLYLWKAAWNAFLHNPVLGVGSKDFRKELQTYEDIRMDFTAVHNTLLESLAMWGLLGTLPWIAFLASLYRRLGRVVKQHKKLPGDFAWLARNARASLIAYFVAAWFLSTWYHMAMWVVIFQALVLLRIADDEHKAALEARPPQEAAAAGMDIRFARRQQTARIT